MRGEDVSEYAEFLAEKSIRVAPVGFDPKMPIRDSLFPFQKAIVRWALKRGRAAVFADCGLGKTLMQLEWADHVCREASGRVLILAPLAVSMQTVAEGERFGITVKYARSPQAETPITITNYEMLDHFNPKDFSGIVLDESSILKAYEGKTRTKIIESFSETPFRLACTATPAPNDFMELGNHSDFLGAMTRSEMLSMFFIHDGGETQVWRLKGHAEKEFWRWVCEWAVSCRKPSDLGFEDDGFTLPPIKYSDVVVKPDAGHVIDGMLFPVEAVTMDERRKARRSSVDERVNAAAELASKSKDQFLIWCNLNAEGDAITREIAGAVQVAGADELFEKERRLMAFARGEIRVLVSKPSIAGWGMNFQSCHNVIFVGLSDSFEEMYQAVRRCWRFGQKSPVNVWIVTSDTEGRVVANVRRKEIDAERMHEGMIENMKEIETANLAGTEEAKPSIPTKKTEDEGWTMYRGDCVEVVKSLPEGSIDYSVFSPPFASLYTYSDSPADMGNSADHEEFFKHFGFLIPELFRATKPGRLLSFHCMNLPTSKARDGVIGISDFRGKLIAAFVSAGWIYHSEVVIWKDPVTAMQRTKAIGLLYKQLRKDSTISRQGIPDYLVTMRKPGENPDRVTKTHESFPVGLWQRFASPVWMDINPSKTLQYRSARENKDERHICPLQLEVIERAIQLWTNPDDLVLSPFAGIGSEGFVALEQGRRFVGVELKGSYFEEACRNLKAAKPRTLFDAPAETAPEAAKAMRNQKC